jgi:hypothetical protein
VTPPKECVLKGFCPRGVGGGVGGGGGWGAVSVFHNKSGGTDCQLICIGAPDVGAGTAEAGLYFSAGSIKKFAP